MEYKFTVTLTLSAPVNEGSLLPMAESIKTAINAHVYEEGIVPEHETAATMGVSVQPFVDRTMINGDGLYDWHGNTKVVPMALCQEANQSGNTRWEECDEKDADYFSVQLEQNENEDGEDWVQVAQFNTAEQAHDFQDMLQTILTLDLPTPW